MRSRDWLLAAVAAVGVTALCPLQDTVSAQSGTGMVISEFRFRGPSGVSDEFIELFNAGTTPVDISGWLVRSSNNVQPPGFFTRATIPANTVVNPGCYYLVANGLSGGFSGGVTPNLTYFIGIADDGGVALTTTSSVIVDQVGQGTVPAAYGEGQRLPMVNINVNRSFERRPGGALGHVDTNNNFADFAEISPARPQNNNPASCLQTAYLPHDIQGAGAGSPIATGTSVTVRGVVTARTLNGFFIQTETGQEDADDATSEGLFVSAGGPALAAAVVGRVVQATGLVSEADSMTQLTTVVSVTDAGAAAVPAAFALTSAELSDLGILDQLERFEGMRVSAAALTAVSGSEAGAFYAVLTGQGRTFREPGIAAGDAVPPCAIGPCHIPLFDGNPERLRVDSDGLEGVAAVALTTGATVTNVIGPLGYSNRIYTLLPESALAPAGGTVTSVAASPLGNEFTVASLTLGASFPAQLPKASMLIRTTLGMPDIVAVLEAADLSAVSALAAAIDADATAAGQPTPQYTAVLAEGTHPDGLDSGFLIKAGRVTMLSLEQIGADATFTDPADNSTQLLHQRPPLVLRAIVTGPATQLPQTLTVIASHLDAFGQGATSMAKRRAQAEFLASYIQFRQSNDPAEAIAALGHYNAHRFNDGHVDIVGTILGTPAPPDQVATEALDLVSPDLISAADSLDPSHRYSSIGSGHAQLFDHVLTSTTLAAQFAGVAYPRVNADFADVDRDDPSVPNRLSDRDPVVAYFSFPPDVEAPVLSFSPGDEIVEAAGPDGAVVSFAVPAASDNLDAAVDVTCTPASGGVFALGSTGVACSAQDAAGNLVEASFSVTVQDTTAPVLILPADINDISDAPGKPVSFVVTAADAVTSSPVVTCAPAPGSTFPIGATIVSCAATDEAGQSTSGSFTVTLTTPVYGRMAGTGQVRNATQRTWFAFDVKESPTFGERGFLVLQIRDGRGRPDRYLSATVSDVRFSNSEGYAPGRFPRSGVDTVAFSGVGSWNGVGGYRFEITAADRGEPGPRQDTFTVRVFAPGGALADTAAGTLQSGNVQSLR